MNASTSTSRQPINIPTADIYDIKIEARAWPPAGAHVQLVHRAPNRGNFETLRTLTQNASLRMALEPGELKLQPSDNAHAEIYHLSVETVAPVQQSRTVEQRLRDLEGRPQTKSA